ncbi:glycosyltransferase [Clostridium sp. HBUAS56017]|uniref:glycosyltransferase n=1 Tax=Clostridium sp. HBUAS56017 TaxID=2571128 RepID=UPI001177929A|nr:glycosyltransferase [Clostridium sp. HBUAS56017]
MNISIICPIYNGEDYIEALNESLMLQESVDIFEIRYILTKSKDNSEKILKNISAKYKVIEPNEFSHSLTREKEVYEAKGDIIVFITQDIIIDDRRWLYHLTKDIVSGLCDASYSRQICENNTIERYTRMKNYSDESRIVSKDDLNRLGIMTYFYSDAASAIKKDVFVELNGYDEKNLLTNEDMYIAYKLINSGYKIKYCSDAKVIHSHKYTYKALFKRYFDQGVFLKQYKCIADAGAGSGALSLVKFVAVNSIKEKNFRAFFDIIPNFGVRFIANKLGSNYEKLSKRMILKFTASTNYWRK